MKTTHCSSHMAQGFFGLTIPLCQVLLAAAVGGVPLQRADAGQAAIQSPDGRNSIILQAAGEYNNRVRYTVRRDGRQLIGPSELGPVLAGGGPLGDGARVVDVQRETIDETFQLRWGKTSTRRSPLLDGSGHAFDPLRICSGRSNCAPTTTASPSATDFCRGKDCESLNSMTK